MNRRIIVKYTAWTVIQNLLRQCKRKGTANTVFAFNGNSAVHQRQQQLGNGKPQTRTIDNADTLAVKQFKGAEKSSNLFIFNADAGIFNRSVQNSFTVFYRARINF